MFLMRYPVCCSVLQCALQCDAVCCSMLQCVAVCRSVLYDDGFFEDVFNAVSPHEKLLGRTWVSNQATRMDLAARTWGVF